MELDILSLVKMIIIGFVQGFTEPIPVSSSGHVMIFSEILGVGEQGFTFAILTNAASLFAIVFIYRKDILRLFTHSLLFLKTKEEAYKNDFRFSLLLIIATIPTGVIGYLLNDYVSDNVSMTTIAIMLFITGIALWLIRNLKGHKEDKDVTKKEAILVGLGQTLSILPGLSRSGTTVISSIAVGMKQETALRFSFLLYIPVSVGTTILGISDFLDEPNKMDLAIPYTLTFITTMIVTYFAVKWFMGIMKSGKLHYFSYYCFVSATLLLIIF